MCADSKLKSTYNLCLNNDNLLNFRLTKVQSSIWEVFRLEFVSTFGRLQGYCLHDYCRHGILCAFGWPGVGRVCRVCLFWVVRSEMKKLREQLRNKPWWFNCIAILCLSEKLTESSGYVGNWKILGAQALGVSKNKGSREQRLLEGLKNLDCGARHVIIGSRIS